MAEEIDYTKILPENPPEGMIEWLQSQGEFASNYIIYKAAYVTNPLTEQKEKMVECKCTACGDTFYQQYVAPDCCCGYASAPFGFFNELLRETVISSQITMCPYCGAEVKACHTSAIRHGIKVNQVYPVSVHMIDGKLALLGWCLYKFIDKSGNTRIVSNMYEGYVFDGRKTIRLVGYNKMLSTLSFLPHWHQLKRCSDVWGVHNNEYTFPWDAEILNGTAFENCKLDMYMQGEDTYPVTYMRLWQRHKNIENLVVQGAAKILNDLISKSGHPSGYYGQSQTISMQVSGIDWKQARPAQMLGLNKEEFKAAVRNNWGLTDLKFYLQAKEYGIKIDDVAQCKKLGYGSVKELFWSCPSVMRAIRYLIKQSEKYPDNSDKINIRFMFDYWDVVTDNGADINNDRIRYPQNLVRAHDTELRKKKWKTDKKLIKMFKDRYKQLSKFCYSNGTLEIHPAKNENEMILEGKLLEHCVGGYANRHANGETAIFFIRKCAEPKEPYFTLELDETSLKVRQNRGYKNCARSQDVIDFEKEWLEYIKKVDKKEKKNGKSDTAA